MGQLLPPEKGPQEKPGTRLQAELGDVIALGDHREFSLEGKISRRRGGLLPQHVREA